MRPSLPTLFAATLFAAPLGLAATAQAATLIGLTADNRLVRIDTESRSAAPPVAVRGAEGRLLGIDVRPADGRLYGVTDAGQIVTLDPATGQASQVSRLSERFESGGRAVVDFNPVADRLRLMGMGGVNFRVHPDTGAVTRDGALKYQPGPLAETAPRITAGAYTNSVAGASATALYTIDTLIGRLNLQAPPNDGVQQPKAELAGLPAGTAFDILADGQGGNTAYLLAGGTLHRLALESGALTAEGALRNLPQAEIIDIAAMR
ncbi:DUF4394 domain-containing protein [Pseudoroseomonas cervicalis]|uniref:DUF4394 domain-containing protein n=1 Tax=Teichococcus cervicalis TaxID=204525 RepID=UPI0022F176D7|nr:DUF4394 domain-containing protein [Pseudoroseomonas cervicalis]WBV42497.1 DUF4394 domain-containing protein [Pseudoroseomonas cervicalis]